MIGGFKTGELNGMPAKLKLQGMMKTILKFVLILHGRLLQPVIEKIRELYQDNDAWTQVTCLYELEGYEGCGYV